MRSCLPHLLQGRSRQLVLIACSCLQCGLAACLHVELQAEHHCHLAACSRFAFALGWAWERLSACCGCLAVKPVGACEGWLTCRAGQLRRRPAAFGDSLCILHSLLQSADLNEAKQSGALL